MCFFKVTFLAEIYTLSLHDALPICRRRWRRARTPRTRRLAAPSTPRASARRWRTRNCGPTCAPRAGGPEPLTRSEEHTSELQSHVNLVCRLLLEKKNQNILVD